MPDNTLNPEESAEKPENPDNSENNESANEDNSTSPEKNPEHQEGNKASASKNIPLKIQEESAIPSEDNTEISPAESNPSLKNKSEEGSTEKTASTGSTTETSAGEKPSSAFPAPIKSRTKESNYQISLIDENLLRVMVSTGKGVKIDSNIKGEKDSEQVQSNEVSFYPNFEYGVQEVEVLISIETEKEAEHAEGEPVQSESESGKEFSSESNFKINLINENLLKVSISTVSNVRIDSTARDKKFSAYTQSNKIYIKPKTHGEIQNIEITIEIETLPVKQSSEGTADDSKVKLVPNPEVVDLIQPPDYSTLYQEETYEAGSYKNPFDALRKLIQRNVTIGIVVAVALHGAAAGVAFYTLGKKAKDQNQEEPPRLIVIQDLPDPKIKLEDIEDPNKPKVEEPKIEEKIIEPKREFPPKRVIRPPTVNRPKEDEEDNKKDTTSSTNLTKELDSLRKLLEETDTAAGKSDTGIAAFDIPDSLRNNFNEKDIGLAMYFPKNWKLTDQREINKNETEFRGVVITDTTAEQPGTMTLFIFLDNENKEYNAEDFKTEFKMNDSTLTAFVKEPKTLAGFTEYRFYIFNKLGTEKLSLRASVRKQFFDQYKNEIEAVVRSIGIRKMGTGEIDSTKTVK